MDHESSPNLTAKKVPIRRPRKACTICRRLKTRCLPDGDNKDPKSRCSRCARLGLVCEYSRATRGRRGGDHHHHHHDQNSPFAPNSQASTSALGRMGVDMAGVQGHPFKWNSMGSYANDPAMASRVVTGGLDDKGMWGSAARPNMFSVHGGQPSPPDHQYARNLDTSRSPAPRSFASLSRKKPVNFLDFLEPPLGANDPNTPTIPDPTAERQPHLYTDPIGAGVLSEQDARHLFHQFMYRVAPTSMLFDPHYHTFERVRSTPALFTTILLVTSRFFRPEISGRLHSLAASQIARKMYTGEFDISVVQSLLVSIQWKHPNDRTAYQKIGAAARLVTELRLEWPAEQNPHAPGLGEEEERRRLDVERTVQNVYAYDVAISGTRQLPAATGTAFPPADQVLNWAESHSHLDLPGDFLRAYLADLWEFYSEFGSHMWLISEETPFKYTREGIESLNRRVHDHMTRWRNHPMLAQEPFATLNELLSKVLALKVQTTGWTQGVAPAVNGSTIVTLAEDILGTIRRAAATGDMLFYSDILSSALSFVGVLLHSGLNLFLPDERHRVLAFLREVTTVFQQLAAKPGGDYTMMYLERFYRRLCGVFERVVQSGDGSDPTVSTSFVQYPWPGHSLGSATYASAAAAAAATTQPVPEAAFHPAPAQQTEWAWPAMLTTLQPWDGAPGVAPGHPPQ